MPITFNSNLNALNARNKQTRSAKEIGKAFSRLSSGLRINQAADDAAGLAIAGRMTARLRSFNMALRNANDGVSVTQTADAALSESTNILERIRELSVQAANGTLTGSDRASIQTEIGGLVDELNRIGEDTEFNTQKLLDGSFQSREFQVGAGAGQAIELSLGDARAQAIGSQATATGGVNAAALAAGDVTIDGQAVRATTAADDALSTVDAAGSAIAKAAAINELSGQTGVTAEAGAAVATGGAAVAAGAVAAGDLVINGVDIGAVNVQAGDADGSLAAAINAATGQTGVTAALGAGGELELTAADGRNIDVQVGGGAAVHGFAASTVARGTVTLSSNEAFTVGGADSANAIGIAAGAVQVDATQNVGTIDVASAGGASSAFAAIDAAIDHISSQRSRIGAVGNRLGSTIENLQASIENLAASRSRIQDADFAMEQAGLIRAQLLQRAGLGIQAQANVSSKVALRLLS